MKKKITFGLIAGLVLLMALSVSALAVTDADITDPVTGITPGGLITLLENIRDWFAAVVAIIAVVMILYGAFLYLTAAGDEVKLGKAKKTILWGVVGIAIALIAYAIFTIVRSILEYSG